MLQVTRAIGAGSTVEDLMTSIEMTLGRRRMMAHPGPRTRRLRRALLACGILSWLLYLATDILGGLRYDGYSFTSQAISELMAIGAPSESFVDPLFLIYGVLALGFGVGVFREGAGRSRALRIAGALLIVYALVGFTGPTLFEMHPRGAGGEANDVPHILVTALLVALLLSVLGVAAFALGKQFRNYTFATLVVVIAFGGLSGMYGARLAAGQPTPGFGIVERTHVYAFLIWIAVFAAVLLRRSPLMIADPQPAPSAATVEI